MLNVIPPVERRPVPALNVLGQTGTALNVEYTDALGSRTNWLPLDSVNLTGPPQYYFDLTAPLPPQRFYRAWQTHGLGFEDGLRRMLNTPPPPSSKSAKKSAKKPRRKK